MFIKKHGKPQRGQSFSAEGAKKGYYTISDLKLRQTREGYSFGYLGHEIRSDATIADQVDAAVIAWLKEHGYDKDDAYQALNSRNGRHMGDALMGTPKKAWAKIVAANLWPFPEAMYACFNETKESLAPKEAR